MERRPLSAPGYHPADSPAKGEGENFNGADFITEFAEMEERASTTMGKENRGHKLPLEELPLKRLRLLPSRASAVVSPTEDEFEEVERTFCEYFHYKKDSGTAGLDASQVRLLHSSWSRFASSDGLLANVLHLPQRLSEAGANIGVRHDLAGAALGILSDALMRMIEEEHERLIILSRLIERLNLQLAVADDEEDSIQQRLAASSPGPASAPRSPSTVVPTSDRPAPETSSLIMEVLALSNEQARQIQRVLRRLAGTRALLVQATQYGHLLGRFLIKRHRRVMELRKGIHTHRIGGITKGKSETSVPVRQ